jgi:hypothetical protein
MKWIAWANVTLAEAANRLFHVMGWLQRCYERPAIAKLMVG